MVQHEVPQVKEIPACGTLSVAEKKVTPWPRDLNPLEFFPVELKPSFFRNILENSKLFAGRSKSPEILGVKPMPDLLASNVMNR